MPHHLGSGGLDSKAGIGLYPQRAARSAFHFGKPFGLKLGFQGRVDGEQRYTRPFDHLRTAERHAGCHAHARGREAVEQRWSFQPRNNLHEAEAVHRGAFVREIVECGFERVIDRAPVRPDVECRKIYRDNTAQSEEIDCAGKGLDCGKGKLARMLSMIQLGDFTSYYLALLVGVDPTPVETIQQLKRTLADA